MGCCASKTVTEVVVKQTTTTQKNAKEETRPAEGLPPAPEPTPVVVDPEVEAAKAAEKVKAEHDAAAEKAAEAERLRAEAEAARVAKEKAEAEAKAKAEEEEAAARAAAETPKVVEEHLKRAKKFFDKMDKDSNGTLEGDELVKLAKWTFEGIHGEGEEPMSEADQQAEIEKLMELDKNKDGALSFDEFGEWWNVTDTAIQTAKHERATAKRAARVQKEAEEKAAAEAAAAEKAAAAAEAARIKAEAEKEAAAAKAAEEARAKAKAEADAARIKAEEEAAEAARIKAQQEEEEATPPSGPPWWEAKLPAGDGVVRKEIRSMPLDEQERYANAVDKMMESVDGEPGSSQYFRLACYHGGPKNEPHNAAGEYCVHRNEAFPGWHRAYLLEFERVLRCADLALGGDGMIGLPYWGWDEPEHVSGQVFPKIVRERFTQYPDDLFPAEDKLLGSSSAKGLGSGGLEVAPDSRIAYMLNGPEWSPSKGEVARKSLMSEQHWQHASLRERSSHKPSIEDPHNGIHGGLRGVMATYESSFHPIFWLHHNNIDRFYQKYVELHPDSMEEFKLKQAKWKAEGGHRVEAGYPEGPYGTYYGGGGAFKTATGKDFHAEHSFVAAELGYSFDQLPTPPPSKALDMTEMPTFAVFPGIEINKIAKTVNLHVFVDDQSTTTKDDALAPTPLVPPASVDDYENHPQYAGSGCIFGLFPPGGCSACERGLPFDVSVDITGALRHNKIRKANAVLVVMVESAADGTLEPVAETTVPMPVIRGPMFENLVDPADIKEGDNDAAAPSADAEALQTYLIANGYKTTDVVDGMVGEKTTEAIKALQAAAGDLTVDGVVGPLTKAKIVAPQFDAIRHDDVQEEAAAPYKRGETVSWYLRDHPGYLKQPALVAELTAAFEAWSPACGVTFEQAESADDAKILIGFGGQQGDDAHIFDGPGGALAKTTYGTPALIEFDEEEKWLLQGDDSAFGAFRMLPVAMHEVGHVIGLSHSLLAGDMMGPWYSEDLKGPSDNDRERCAALYPPATSD